jgi:hypothetical protein
LSIGWVSFIQNSWVQSIPDFGIIPISTCLISTRLHRFHRLNISNLKCSKIWNFLSVMSVLKVSDFGALGFHILRVGCSNCI